MKSYNAKGANQFLPTRHKINIEWASFEEYWYALEYKAP